ncbi:carbohydrate ABC transporter permease, partial [Falsihalocynthiibacter sp. BN13B15]
MNNNVTIKRNWSMRNNWLMLIGPALLMLGATTLYPIGFAVFLSFQEWNWGATSEFIGLANFVEILGKNTFWTALFNTFYFSAGAVTAELLLGLGLAVAINRLGFGAGVIRTMLLLPLMVSGIAVALVWKILLDPTLGIVN